MSSLKSKLTVGRTGDTQWQTHHGHSVEVAYQSSAKTEDCFNWRQYVYCSWVWIWVSVFPKTYGIVLRLITMKVLQFIQLDSSYISSLGSESFWKLLSLYSRQVNLFFKMFQSRERLPLTLFNWRLDWVICRLSCWMAHILNVMAFPLFSILPHICDILHWPHPGPL